MFFVEDSDEEYASLKSQEGVLSGRAEQQRIARRNLSSAVLFFHKRSLLRVLDALRERTSTGRHSKGAISDMCTLPIWRQGEYFQRQRHRLMANALRALIHNTDRHKKVAALHHHVSRVKSVAFGGIIAYVKEQRAMDDINLARAADFVVSRHLCVSLRRWSWKLRGNRQLFDNVRLADILSAIVLMRRGVDALQSHKIIRLKFRAGREHVYRIIKRKESRIVKQCLHILHVRVFFRLNLSRRSLKNPKKANDARCALRMLHDNISSGVSNARLVRAQLPPLFKKLQRSWLLRRGMRALTKYFTIRRTDALCNKKLVVANGTGSNFSLNPRRTRYDFLKQRRAFQRFLLSTRSLYASKQRLQIADKHYDKSSCAASFFLLRCLHKDRRDARRSSQRWDEFSKQKAKQRVLTRWLRRLNAALVQASALDLAKQHTLPRKSSYDSERNQRAGFLRKGRALTTWIASMLRQRRVNKRRLRLARTCYEDRMRRHALQALRSHLTCAKCARNSILLAGFSKRALQLSRALSTLRHRANVSPPHTQPSAGRARRDSFVNTIRSKRERFLSSVMFWKIWRMADGLQRWKVFLNSKRRRRYEWVSSQQAHRNDLAVLGVRLWVAAAGEKMSNRCGLRDVELKRRIWRVWLSATQQSRIRRGIQPSLMPNIAAGGGKYVRLTPVGDYATESSSIKATLVAAKYTRAVLPAASVTAAQAQSLSAAGGGGGTTSRVTPVQKERSLLSETPGSPPPLHRAPPRTYVYDQEFYKGGGVTGSPVSIAHSSAKSPGPGPDPGSGLSRGVGSIASLSADSSPENIFLKQRAERVAVAREIISLVTELRNKLHA